MPECQTLLFNSCVESSLFTGPYSRAGKCSRFSVNTMLASEDRVPPWLVSVAPSKSLNKLYQPEARNEIEELDIQEA